MARKSILFSWIGLPGAGPPEFSDPGFWDISDLLPLAEASMDFSTTLVGPGTMQLSSTARIDGPESRPGFESTICFSRTRVHNLRIAGTIFGTDATGVA
jgi:hypothetical protein